MLDATRKRKVTGIFLIVIGALFLMVSNNIWLGWSNVWPLFPILAGLLLLRVFAGNRTPEMLFGGITSLLAGLFLLLFSLGIFPWSRMDVLWPVFPAIAGVGLLGVAGAAHRGTTSVVLGVVMVLFAFLGLLREGGVINERIVSPFIRLWPLVLVVAGVTMIRTRSREEDPDMKAVSEAIDDGVSGTAGSDPPPAG
jgi:hypothetical protein